MVGAVERRALDTADASRLSGLATVKKIVGPKPEQEITVATASASAPARSDAPAAADGDPKQIQRQLFLKITSAMPDWIGIVAAVRWCPIVLQKSTTVM